ncbi:MAG: DegT/DnrJ/EryC1/StrS family aminotransferase [Pirellulales bacterium]|nr:DegT/DnrJ/EryC1/StrS family aminotransferase [Pirellulales bacterium]
MKIPFHDLQPVHRELIAELQAAVTRVLQSGWFLLGPEAEAFEHALARQVESEFAIGVANGTDAIELALRAAGVSAGAEVITVAHTAIPTVCAVERAGAKVVFADIDPRTYALDVAAAAAAITPRTEAILPVHLYGHPADMTALSKLASDRGLLLVEDCAQALGARHAGRPVGSWGCAAAYSFYPTKNLAACGDAGGVTTNDRALAERVRRVRFYGQATRDRCQERGFNSRLDEVQAVILQVKLEHFAAHHDTRLRLAERYSRELPPELVPYVAPGDEHAYCLYVIRHSQRAQIAAALAERGVATLVHYPTPIHLQPAYVDLGYAAGSLPETEAAAREVLSLPLYVGLSEAAVDYVVQAVHEALAECPA